MSNLLIKNKDVIYEQFGQYPMKRTISELFEKGFIVLDKDSGPTSHQTTDMLKKVLDVPKAGHSGTLDPKVTGILVIGLGRGTRLMEYMLKSNKEYVCLLYLHKEVAEDKVRNVFKKFTGVIEQLPPIVSAVKRQLRKRRIYKNEILQIRGQYVLFRCLCERGTYMRKLCTDMAADLGVGGQMVELRRIKAGPFREEDNSIGLDKLRNLYELYTNAREEGDEGLEIYETELRKYIRPMEDLLADFKKVYVRDSAIDTLSHGYDLAIPGVCKLDDRIGQDEEIAVFTLKGELVAMGTALMGSDEIMAKKNGMCVKINKVFVDNEYYPTAQEILKLQKKK